MTDNENHDVAGRIGAEPEELAPAVLAAAIALRAPVEARPDFETRVMAEVRQASQPQEIVFAPWWRRRSIRLSPALASALAASIAVAAFLGARTIRTESPAAGQTAAAPAAATRQVVRFIFVDPNAQRVSVVGSFNHWQKDATPLQATGVPGVWAVSVQLEAGMHEYAFVIDGERWAADPTAPGMTDEFGTPSSIVRIQGPTSS